MKKNSKKLFLWLSGRTNPKDWVSLEHINTVIPLSSTSLRALLKLHQKSGLLLIDTTQAEWYVQVTQQGRELINELFPAVSSTFATWEGHWTLIVFRDAPKTDKQFRYLREQLVTIQAGSVARGVYLYPGDLPVSTVELLRTLYSGKSVSVAKVNEWQLGSLEAIMNDVFKLSDIANLYSGISNEVSQLLTKRSGKKELNSSDKLVIRSVFDRLYETTAQDLGIVSHYFSRVRSVDEILTQMWSLLTL